MDTYFYNSIALKKFYRFKISSIFKSDRNEKFSFLSLLEIELILTAIFPMVLKSDRIYKSVSTDLFKSDRTKIKAIELIALIKAIEPIAFRWTRGLIE